METCQTELVPPSPKGKIFPAVYIIFSVLNAFRHGIPRQNIWREFRRQGIPMRPRLAFWLALCRQAKLLSRDPQPRITRYVRRWLALEPDVQAFHLLEAWQIEEEHLVASISRQTELLWDLETCLRPYAPGVYPLTRQALLLAMNRGNRDVLIELLERGTKRPLPPGIRARILEQPSLQILDGTLIEFSHPADLEAARRNPNLRRCFERVLSPRHVFPSARDAPALLRLLARWGVQLSSPQEQSATKRKRTHFYRTPTPKPKDKAVPVLQLLEKHLELQQALDILYHAPGYQVEKRRITPIIIEKRGEHTYVSAYYQTRRANRTFRLDRMEILGTFNAG
jgi:hypothetical protein